MAASSRFTMLPPNYLADQPPASEITMQSLLDTQERLAEEAREVLPYSFDECTYSKGYLRQAVWSCLDCEEKGVCYGCSISCHADHRLVELWTKRKFRCDCPTISMFPDASTSTSTSTASQSSSSRRHQCTLNPPDKQLQLPNDDNTYSKNFSGKFCRCGRSYDPETEEEAMLNCMACEDWFHETCLNLRNPIVKSEVASTIKVDTSNELDSEPPRVEEDDDEEATVLIPSESYDGLICTSCVQSHPFLKEKAGSTGWMIIEPNEDGLGYHVIGKGKGGSEVVNETSNETSVGVTGVKRSMEDGDESITKKIKTDQGAGSYPSGPQSEGIERKWKGKGDIFLANGIREQLRKEFDSETIASLPFPLIDEEVYEPPQDDEEGETLDQVTSRVIESMPRVQAIEALHGYEVMKDKLKGMLASHVQTGQTVSREDIEGLFAELRQQKAR